MIYQCPNCASALIYDPEENCLVCHHCDSTFQPEDIETNYMPKLRMKFHIYSCTACGAEIMVTENEAATFCIYCGQPVIVFDRVSSELQPDYIIPFKTTKEAAYASLRYSIRKKFFVPKAFKNFKPDTLRGIYIPFWLYDINYSDKQYYSVTGRTAGGLVQKDYGYCKEVNMKFKNLPINASCALNDEELQLLGKFYPEEMERFNPGYLCGFYADRYDIDYKEAIEPALKKAEAIFDDEVQTPLRKRYDNLFVDYKAPKANIEKIQYILLPVWFMTFRYKEHPYTLLINGQTGTVAGNLPIHKGKATLLFILCSIIAAPPFALFAYWIYLAYIQNQNPQGFEFLLALVYSFFIGCGLALGYIGTTSIRKGLRFSRSAKVQKYVKERQNI